MLSIIQSIISALKAFTEIGLDVLQGNQMVMKRCICSRHILAVFVGLVSVCFVSVSSAQRIPEVQSGVVIVQFDSTIHIQRKSLHTGMIAFDQMGSTFEVYEIERVYPFLDHVTPTPTTRKNLLALRRTYYVRYHAQVAPLEVSESFSVVQGVVYAEPVVIHRLHTYSLIGIADPNDPEFESQVDLHQMGFPDVWDEVKSESANPKIVIAIVDGGGEWAHEDLLENVWTNEDEIPRNGIDDDHNGFIDDVHGIDLSDDDEADNNPDRQPNVAPPTWHGTATAGIAAAVTDNRIGIAGTSWNASLMHINASHESGLGIKYGYQGILYAASNGADIINVSWGGFVDEISNVQFMNQSLDLATDMGALIIASAGNNASNIDRFAYYPAGHSRVLSVGATQKGSTQISRFSNFGRLVDVFAPGVSVLTTATDNRYIKVSGTSFSAPLVSGVAALVKAKFPDLSPDAIREKIRFTAESIDAQNPAYRQQLGRGFINALSVVQDSVISGIRLKEWSWVDDDGNQSITSGDHVKIKANFVNYLSDASNVSVSIIPMSSYSFLEMTTDQVSIGGLSGADSAEAIFEFRVTADAMPNQRVRFYTRVEGDGIEDIAHILSLPINRSIEASHHSLSVLYTRTAGDRWRNNSNWNIRDIPNEEELQQWYGLTIIDGWVSELNLQYNNLVGEIPDELTNLTQLRTLLLSGNRLSGLIPDGIQRLTELERLNLSVNSLSGPIPAELGKLSHLRVLDIFDNSFNGDIPASLGNLSELKSLNLEGNSLTGEIPLDLSNLWKLEWLGLRDNQLSGQIPHELGALPQLMYLDLGENLLSGTIPIEFGDLTHLKWLVLPENSLTGEIPSELKNLTNLELLDLSQNSLTGSIPIALTSLSKMSILDLSGNQLSGRVPSELGRLTRLTRLNLSDNDFSGSLPRELLALDSLDTFLFEGQGLCAPQDREYQAWLERIANVRGSTCGILAFSHPIEDQNFVLDHPITPVIFPVVTSGIEPISYSISPSLPSGLRFQSSTRTLTGTPSAITEMPIEFTYSARDDSGAVGRLSFKMDIRSSVSNEDESMPKVFTLHGNYPNPFQDHTLLTFDLPSSAHLKVEVTDISGRKVLSLPERQMEAGWSKTLSINTETLPSGLYVYQVVTQSSLGRESQTGRFVHFR